MSLNILFLEPFYGGSHRAFADGFTRHSKHRVTLKTLPARFWKWRMRGAALHFYKTMDNPGQYDLIMATDLMSLSDLKSLWGAVCPPLLLYMHENQLTYPLPPGETMDYHFGFTDITSALSADRILFNSRTHMEAFFATLPDFIRKMPEYKPLWAVDDIRSRSSVLYPGCEFADLRSPRPRGGNRIPTILWNHRWEFDKRPEAFFAALDAADRRGYDFRLLLLGENFQMVPEPFISARERYGQRVLHYGYMPSRAEYARALRSADIVVSTAGQENFGISVIEAVRAGAFPLCPHRLSYPEILPDGYHQDCLYTSDEELAEKLCGLLDNPGDLPAAPAEEMEQYAWERVLDAYDRVCEETAGRIG